MKKAQKILGIAVILAITSSVVGAILSYLGVSDEIYLYYFYTMFGVVSLVSAAYINLYYVALTKRGCTRWKALLVPIAIIFFNAIAYYLVTTWWGRVL